MVAHAINPSTQEAGGYLFQDSQRHTDQTTTPSPKNQQLGVAHYTVEHCSRGCGLPGDLQSGAASPSLHWTAPQFLFPQGLVLWWVGVGTLIKSTPSNSQHRNLRILQIEPVIQWAFNSSLVFSILHLGSSGAGVGAQLVRNLARVQF